MAADSGITDKDANCHTPTGFVILKHRCTVFVHKGKGGKEKRKSFSLTSGGAFVAAIIQSAVTCSS